MPLRAGKLGEKSPLVCSLIRYVTVRHTAHMDTSTNARIEHPDDIAAVPTAVPERLTCSVAETAHLLGVSRPTVYRLMARRVLIPIPGLRHKRISKKQVRRLVEIGNGADAF
jgi:excisionase family DNA binding protein